MAFLKNKLDGREFIAVNGSYTKGLTLDHTPLQLRSIEKFYKAVECHPDAVVLGYLGGRSQKWVADA